MAKQIVVFVILLTSVYFFKLVFIPYQMGLVIGFGACMLMLLWVLLAWIYGQGVRFKQNSKLILILVFLAVILGAFGAKWGHAQSFFLSLWASGYMYFYLLYFFLHAIRLRTNDLEKIIIGMGILFLLTYFFQYAIYPKVIFGVRQHEERGTIRIFLPGASFAAFAFYYFLQKTFTTDKKIYVIFCLLYLTVPILQGTRSSISTILLGTIVFILINKQVKSKMLVMFLMFTSAMLVFFIFQDIFMNLIEVSKSQAAQEDDDVRIRASRFFLFEFSPTTLNKWIGNGESHMASTYGMKVYFYKAFLGFYQSDIGIIGEYSKYGVLWLFCVFFISRKFFTTRTTPQFNYIKFWAFNLMFDLILNGAFTRSYEIAVIASVLYILDVSNFELRNPDPKPNEELITD